ncbi:MAG: hypothetical protein IKN72_03125 [Clostridia bacterium]|nr:hypothetical protein [Clostridia bacterium]
MRNTTKRAYVLFALIAVFFIGFAILAVRFGMNGEKWATDVHNELLATTRVPSLYAKSTITDRNGKMLFESDKDKGHNWSADPTIRKATLHVVGDAGNIGSSILKQSKEIILEPTYTYDLVNGLQVTKVQEGDDVDRDIQLTIDADVCKAAYNAVLENADSDHGSIIAYNYKTGEVYCLTSLPSYDPKNPPKEPESGTYSNHALNERYAPGSTFKIVTSICAIENGMGDFTFRCTGSNPVGGKDINCYDKTKHGNLTIQTGLNKSCNGIFSQLAVELGVDKMTATLTHLGFFEPVEINGIKTKASNYAPDVTNKNLIGWSGVGQDKDLINPCQMMMLMGAIANNGTAIIPTLINDPATMGTVNQNIRLDPQIAKQMQTYLRSDVTAVYGDGYFPNMQFCAKSGTAQTGTKNQSHAWFVGFSLREDFPVAIVVCLEDLNKGMGGEVAKKAASAVLNNLIKSPAFSNN